MTDERRDDEPTPVRQPPRPLGAVPAAPSSGGLDVGSVQGSAPGGPSLDVGSVQGGLPSMSASAGSGGGGILTSIGEAFAKKKIDLLVAAMVGAVAGGTAGTIGGTGAGLGAGWASSDAESAADDAPPPISDASGTLRVLSQPSGAAVTMDGTALGSSPVDVRAAGGMHTVSLSLDGYESHQVHLSVPTGGSFTLSVPLVAIAETPDAGVEIAAAPRRGGGGGYPRRPPQRDCSSERSRCESGCRSAETSCEMSCPGCSSCSTTEGWDSCRERCATCRQSCRNNRGFCEEQCRTSEGSCRQANSGW